MYRQKVFFFVVVIVGFWSVNCMDLRRTSRPPSSSSPKPHQQKDNHLTTIIDQFDRRYPDGTYEYRYQQSDGSIRYERGYLASINGGDFLVVRGYYSHRLSDGKYLTVFYIADDKGYRQESSQITDIQPDLPQTLDKKTYSASERIPIASTTPKNKRVRTTTLKPALTTRHTTLRPSHTWATRSTTLKPSYIQNNDAMVPVTLNPFLISIFERLRPTTVKPLPIVPFATPSNMMLPPTTSRPKPIYIHF